MSQPPFVEQQITFLPTRDLATTARFYEDFMGLELALDQDSCRIYHVSGNAYLGFCQREDTASETSGVIFTLVTSKVDEWRRYLQERGVAFEKPPEINPKYNIYHFFLRDPNGHLIEIQQFLHPFPLGDEQ